MKTSDFEKIKNQASDIINKAIEELEVLGVSRIQILTATDVENGVRFISEGSGDERKRMGQFLNWVGTSFLYGENMSGRKAKG